MELAESGDESGLQWRLRHCVWLTKVAPWSLSSCNSAVHSEPIYQEAFGERSSFLEAAAAWLGAKPTSNRPSCIEQLDLPMYHLAAGVLLCLRDLRDKGSLTGRHAAGECCSLFIVFLNAKELATNSASPVANEQAIMSRILGRSTAQS